MKNFEVKELMTGLPIVNGHAAGIDVGDKEMWVTYTNLDGKICQFSIGCFTKDLDEIVQVFKEEGVSTVAMESTGVYGGPLREKLELSGISVTVINPGMYKKPGIKDDPHDSSWIHLYHSVDLFKNSHLAPEHWRDLREYIHERDVIVTQKAITLTRMNRQLEMMNCKLPTVVSDIEGVGAMKIIRAIAEGETNPEKLVNLLNLNLFKASKEDLIESLRGNYRPCLVNVLKEKLTEYDFFVSQMRKYEQYIIFTLENISTLEEQKRMVKENMELKENKGLKENKELKKNSNKKTNKKSTKPRKNEYSFDGATYLCRILEIDLTKVEGFSDKTLMLILSVT
ncbi:MAG: transposase, partial [Prevotellaceae bacterium]|nr:transposase [Prevotellaceae bacterium]